MSSDDVSPNKSNEKTFWFESRPALRTIPCPEQDLCLKELTSFLEGVTRLSKARSCSSGKSAINLLKSTWTSLDAVLEYTENVFDESVGNYIMSLERKDSSSVDRNVDDDQIQEMHSVLSEFVKEEPDVWAPRVSTWALRLLGKLSSKYANPRLVPNSSNLPEVLQLWMTCRSTRALIELTTQCLHNTLTNSNPDPCIDALIETSVQHSPHFDWVMAHIGSCFPMTIITKVLACGLKDFYLHQDSTEGFKVNPQLRTSKIASVVDILGHLALHHNADMRSAINSLFNESLKDVTSREQLTAGPFLLHLASSSDILSDVISSQFVTVVSPETLNTISCQVEKWKAAQIPGTDGLVHLVVSLLLRSDGGCQVICCLLDIMSPTNSNIHTLIKEAAGLVLDSVLLELQRRVYGSPTEIPLLHFLKSHILDLCSNLSEGDKKKANWIFNLMKLVCIHGNDSFTVSVLGQLLSSTDKASSHLAALAQEIHMSKPNSLSLTISDQMAQLKSEVLNDPIALVRNLTSLIQTKQLTQLVTDAIRPNIEVLASHVSSGNMEYSDALIELMSIAVVTEEMPMSSLFKVGTSAVTYLFNILSDVEMSSIKKIRLVDVTKTLFSKLCCQTATQNMILRLILEGILEEKYATLFDAKLSKMNNILRTGSSDVSLLDENIKHMSSITLPPNHCSIFYSGIIGSGLRTLPSVKYLPKDKMLFNKQTVLDVIQICCKPSWRYPLDESTNYHPQSLIPGMKVVALLMVELISPDIMFNGLPWPDEDYFKVSKHIFTEITIERDLHIKKMFETHSILWDLLSLVATVQPSLCYCSVLLRGIMAVLLSHWSSNQEDSTRNSPKQLEMSQRLINIMSIGQILPPPLSYIDEVLPFVSPYEAYNLLANIWQYMQENVPSPALFSAPDNTVSRMWRNFPHNNNGKHGFCDKKYTNGLRFIMFANIEKFGSMYAKFFPID